MITLKYPIPASPKDPASQSHPTAIRPPSISPTKSSVQDLSPRRMPSTSSSSIDDSSQANTMDAESDEARCIQGEDQEIADGDTASNADPPSSHQDLTIQTEEIQSSSAGEPETPLSVIQAPGWFGQFPGTGAAKGASGESVSDKSNVTVVQSSTSPATNGVPDKKTTTSPVSPHALTTSMASPSENWADDATPRAQTRQEVEQLKGKQRQSSLEGIPEQLDSEPPHIDTEDEEDADITVRNGSVQNPEELSALRAALSECWTLCNTLATLSCSHRERLFNYPGRDDKQEHAWKTCWKLCQNLYDHRDNDSYPFNVKPTLDLCREFCQALFEIRIRDNEVADSVLRVSFELNNHLYNTHDRNLPEAFRERTLDFYITLCHRLMKQRAGLAEETDSLLRACWSLAEMLFNLRQSKRDGRPADEELLGSAVQACWDLCDIFRDGWTQIRPDRRLPSTSQTNFSHAFYEAKRKESTRADELAAAQGNPETPTTIFEDTATVAADQASVPNIVVLGSTGSSNSNSNTVGQPRWSSSASSTLSGYSSTSSTHTIRSQAEDPNLANLKLLIVRTAMNTGFQRGGPQDLPSFTKSLSSDSFGTLSWQTSLLTNYRKLVSGDPAFRNLPPPSRASAIDIARAVDFMVQNNRRYSWLRDLYRWVFGFRIEDSAHRSNVGVQI